MTHETTNPAGTTARTTTATQVALDISMSLDGFVTADGQTPDEPMGRDGARLHAWLGSDDDRDRQVLEEGAASAGAVITGRRNFEHALPWWGADGPTGPARLPVFVLGHDVPDGVPEDSVYTFVTDGIETALAQARAAADGRVVCVMGGAETARGFVETGLVDEISIHLVPVLLGGGTSLFEGLELGEHLTLEHAGIVQTPDATHLRYRVVRR
jgi:dihydrofolate reductase